MTPDRNRYIGKMLPGGYHIERFIGKGAFAWVYRARTPAGEVAAIKVQYNLSDDSLKRFMREIKVLRELPSSPHCVRYIGDGETEEGLPFLVMEFVDGQNLKQILRSRPIWGERPACELVIQLCDAFAGLHQLGLVHRDVKPENIMLTHDNQVKLMDFGLVKDAQGLLKLFESEDILAGHDFAENIDRGVLAGTPEYMAPEQFSDPSVAEEQTQTDTWTDVYSIALIFHEMLMGEKVFPFRPGTKKQSEYARALLSYLRERTGFDDASLIQPPSASEGLWTVLERALRQNPKLRQRNAVELGEQLRHYLTTGEGVFIEDEDKTSAININDFFARIRDAPGRAGGAGSALGEGGPDFFDEDGKTTPLNRDQLQAILAAPRPPGAMGSEGVPFDREAARAALREKIMSDAEIPGVKGPGVRDQPPATGGKPIVLFAVVGGAVLLVVVVLFALL